MASSLQLQAPLSVNANVQPTSFFKAIIAHLAPLVKSARMDRPALMLAFAPPALTSTYVPIPVHLTVNVYLAPQVKAATLDPSSMEVPRCLVLTLEQKPVVDRCTALNGIVRRPHALRFTWHVNRLRLKCLLVYHTIPRVHKNNTFLLHRARFVFSAVEPLLTKLLAK